MYEARISRSTPTLLLCLMDQSGSMEEKMTSGKTKAQTVADVLNRTIDSLIMQCRKAAGVLHYYDIGIIAYGDNGVYNGFQGELANSFIQPLNIIESSPLRIEERKKREDDGAGGIMEQNIKFPVWFEPKASGGTPMCQAITKVAEELVPWCDSHPDSYPPTILHITDGASTDGDPEALATQAKQIQTNDGSVLFFNLHLSTSGDSPIMLPASEFILPDPYSKLLFRMSSILPEQLIRFARDVKGYSIGIESRGFMFNADNVVQIVDFFDIGSKTAQLG